MNESNQNSPRHSTPHIKLFIPGPTEVLPEILDAQANWMIGHRMPECAELIGRIEPKLQQVFLTKQRVLINASTGTGFMEAAVRNTMNGKTLNCVNGAFSDRMREITELNGKNNEVLEVEWGKAITADLVAEKLAVGGFDAITVAHNETSTGVTSPVKKIAEAVRKAPNGENIIIIVDAVSSLGGAKIEFDAWDLDVLITSSQKAFALPPGIAFCGVSERAMQKAATVPNRGFYFDFITLAKSLDKNQTPSTTPISLLFALDKQLDIMMAEGMENRYERHLAMRARTIEWAKSKGFEIFPEAGYESPTLTCITNNLEINVSALNNFLRTKGMYLSSGYGTELKNITFRIAHMGELTMADMNGLFAAIDEFMAQ